MERMLDVMTVFSVLLLALVLISVRRAHIRVEYSVSWLVAAVVLLAMSRARGLVADATRWLGVSDAAVAIVTIAGGVFLLVLYRMSLLLSNLKDTNIALVQRVAILEYRLESLNEKAEAAARD